MSGHRAVFVPVALLAALIAVLGGLAVSGLGMTAAASVGAHLAGTAGCGKAPTLASGTHTIQSSGQNRNYILRIPTNYDNNHPYRLIFGFHWVGGTANDVDSGGTDGYNWSYYGLRRLADNAGNTTIFVAPQGNNNGWANPGGQDITFVDDMIRQLEAGLCIDTTQLFSTGFSYGGAMTYALACARATVFRAVAVYSGANLSGCNGGTQPIAYMGLHGLRDNVLPISNGRALRDTFVRANGCTPQNPPEPAQGSLTHIVTTYSGCKAGYPVVWAAFDGAGHDPGPIDGCTCDGWHTWTSGEVWKFFTQFDSSTPPPPTSTTPPPSGACTASYRTVNSWQGGFQGEVTVTAGSAAVNGWTVRWTLDGQTITQVWNGTLTATGSSVSISNASYNGSLPAAGSTTFGFLANGTPPTSAPSCTSP
ncbi:poly(3-hydroxybutyrate) depolymerase [Kutzneria kofuensis]|uniref:Poly(3-hydroxybutyrate) depolymerase n=2 Tax=Kutzneria kofuensis TaxID=103725 RepID=A0A7W9NLQ8_9PSEU|nr:cellulose binding domain-containing protein [Kutzneria kofuensis]MBB5897862.1 poly(3-hydroxybutyrate) depolymerase [Kutzneria kofuensis]